MPQPMRKSILPATQADILVESRRRCAMCFHLHGDLSVKAGQIAHIDRERSNNAEANLCFLCLEHHDEYDRKHSQSKGWQPAELTEIKSRFQQAITSGEHLVMPKPQPAVGLNTDRQTLAKIEALMTQAGTLEVLQQHNFGGPFATAVLDVVNGFCYQTGAGHEFIDQELEQKRAAFLGACNAFSHDAGHFTFNLSNSHLRRVPAEWHTANREHYDKVVEGLNGKATALFAIYDDLVRSARRRLAL